MVKTVVVAFGGNALQPPHEGAADFAVDLSSAANAIADIVEEGHRLVITHGNGPQVGYGMMRNVWAPEGVPRLSMDSLVAQSQGELGTLLSIALINAFARRSLRIPVVSVVTHVLVDVNHPSFHEATKPIGPVVNDPVEMANIIDKVHLPLMQERGGYRIAVPSPLPQKVVESMALKALLECGTVVIAGGGGGIPVAYDQNGHLHGVAGVIDKDRTSALLAAQLEADHLVFLTDVDGVYRDFGKPTQALVAEGTWEDFDMMMRDPQASGVGSMKPKMAAACDFVKTTGNSAAIGNLQQAARVVSGVAGTRIVWKSKEGRQNAN